MEIFQDILEKVSDYIDEKKRARIVEAFKYAGKMYSGKYTFSGDLLIEHCLKVLDTMVGLKPGVNALIAALLYYLPEQKNYDRKEVKKLFGEDVADLVDSLAALNKIKIAEKGTDIEALRKMFMVLAKDLRVVIIKLAERLNSMQALDFKSQTVRKELAKETMDIYVPIASRLGIYGIKTHLEDLCFKYLYPRQYEDLSQQLNDYMLKYGRTIDEIRQDLGYFLSVNGIEAKVDGRIKNVFSVYKKLKTKNHTTLDDIYDVFAIRVVLPDKFNSERQEVNDHLYSVLGLIHGKWTPVMNRFKDYCAVPKPNGYQSLHTAVIGISPKSLSKPTEIQIRTERMHYDAENGVTSHWLYEDNKKTLGAMTKKRSTLLEGKEGMHRSHIDWISALNSVEKEIKDGNSLEETLKFDVFTDRIFVFTPAGAVRDLPQGATPVDFAYAIHSDIGNHTQIAKVNGAVVPLNYELKNGQVVEIITNSSVTPKTHWLSFVKTSMARNKIRVFLRSLDKDYNFKQGKDLFNKALINMKKNVLDEELSILKLYDGSKLSYKQRYCLLEEVGTGAKSATLILRKLFGDDEVFKPKPPNIILKGIKTTVALPRSRKKRSQDDKNQIYIAGEYGVPYKISNCCKPKQGTAVVGYVTRGSFVSIHSENCKFLDGCDNQRLIGASWGHNEKSKTYPIKLNVKAKNRMGLIRDIADAISKEGINILDFGISSPVGDFIVRQIILEMSDSEQFEAVLERLRRVRDVMEITQVK